MLVKTRKKKKSKGYMYGETKLQSVRTVLVVVAVGLVVSIRRAWRQTWLWVAAGPICGTNPPDPSSKKIASS